MATGPAGVPNLDRYTDLPAPPSATSLGLGNMANSMSTAVTQSTGDNVLLSIMPATTNTFTLVLPDMYDGTTPIQSTSIFDMATLSSFQVTGGPGLVLALPLPSGDEVRVVVGAPPGGGVGANGDPHFVLWPKLSKQASPWSLLSSSSLGQKKNKKSQSRRTRYDFHGECDLVLLSTDALSTNHANQEAVDAANTKTTTKDATSAFMNPSYHHNRNLDITVHLRTTIRRDAYSYIQAVAIQFKNATKSSDGKVVQFEPKRILVNGQPLALDSDTATFPVKVGTWEWNNNENGNDNGTTAATTTTIKSKSILLHRIPDTPNTYQLEWQTGAAITVRAIHIFMNVDIQDNHVDFQRAAGMMGQYGTGYLVNRQGQRIDKVDGGASNDNITNNNDDPAGNITITDDDMIALGMEWQVKPDLGDPLLFDVPRAPQWPSETCRLPTKSTTQQQQRRRNLRADPILTAQAKRACASLMPHDSSDDNNHINSDYDMCVNDVLLTGEVGLAETFF